jgi:hypothetical protein
MNTAINIQKLGGTIYDYVVWRNKCIMNNSFNIKKVGAWLSGLTQHSRLSFFKNLNASMPEYGVPECHISNNLSESYNKIFYLLFDCCCDFLNHFGMFRSFIKIQL